jgi:hypothetical protein
VLILTTIVDIAAILILLFINLNPFINTFI